MKRWRGEKKDESTDEQRTEDVNVNIINTSESETILLLSFNHKTQKSTFKIWRICRKLYFHHFYRFTLNNLMFAVQR